MADKDALQVIILMVLGGIFVGFINVMMTAPTSLVISETNIAAMLGETSQYETYQEKANANCAYNLSAEGCNTVTSQKAPEPGSFWTLMETIWALGDLAVRIVSFVVAPIVAIPIAMAVSASVSTHPVIIILVWIFAGLWQITLTYYLLKLVGLIK